MVWQSISDSPSSSRSQPQPWAIFWRLAAQRCWNERTRPSTQRCQIEIRWYSFEPIFAWCNPSTSDGFALSVVGQSDSLLASVWWKILHFSYHRHENDGSFNTFRKRVAIERCFIYFCGVLFGIGFTTSWMQYYRQTGRAKNKRFQRIEKNPAISLLREHKIKENRKKSKWIKQ